MKKILVVVDIQNDFVDGALGSKEAAAIIGNACNKIRSFDGDIYGKEVDVRLISFIRPEKKFAGIDELKNAIIENGNTALEIFRSNI